MSHHYRRSKSNASTVAVSEAPDPEPTPPSLIPVERSRLCAENLAAAADDDLATAESVSLVISSSSSSSSSSSASFDADEAVATLSRKETAKERKAREASERVEVKKLMRKNKKKVYRCVSCLIVPLAGFALLKRALETIL